MWRIYIVCIVFCVVCSHSSLLLLLFVLSASSSPTLFAASVNPLEYLGASLSSGDFDSDGQMETVVGAPGNGSSQFPMAGRVYVYGSQGKGIGSIAGGATRVLMICWVYFFSCAGATVDTLSISQPYALFGHATAGKSLALNSLN